ncbi:hypothetical protein WMY93_008450 [Mugilogobius chulae]|uniref:Uncharacterized protein n=1 Tax=Mugilogobius chulae TaxID=88201 RepID=A0AAW0PJE4_9GOBI
MSFCNRFGPIKENPQQSQDFCCIQIILPRWKLQHRRRSVSNRFHYRIKARQQTLQNIHDKIKTGELELKDIQNDSLALDVPKQDTVVMKSQYQKDFPPPTSCRRRRTPALPQPDNIGINPAFR